MNRVRAWYENAYPQDGRSPRETSAAWRGPLLHGTLLAGVLLGLPAALLGSLAVLPQGDVYRAALFGLCYLAIVVLAVARRLPSGFRAGALLTVLFVLAVDALLATGLPGSGRLLLVAFCALGVLLFGMSGGLVTLVLSFAATALVAFGITSGSIPFSPAVMPSTELTSWLSSAGVFLLVAFLVAVPVVLLEGGLLAASRRAGDLAAEVEAGRANLERLVAERSRGLERRTLQLQTTAEIARIAVQSTDPGPLMIQAIDLIRDRFGFYHASIFTLDETGSWAVLRASTGEAGRALLSRDHRLAVGSASLVGWVTGNRLPRVSNDVGQDPFHYKNPLLPDTRAELTLPMSVGGRLIGVLDVQSTEKGAFTEEDVRALEAIAGELAIAIDNARLVRETADELQRAEGLYRGRARESWARFARAGVPTMLRVGAGEGEFREASMAITQQAFDSVAAAHSEDGHEVAVPIIVRGEAIATISARRPAENEPWAKEDVELIQAAAVQVGLALESARQYAEEQRRVAELEVVNRVAQAVSQLLRLDSLFHVVHAQMSQVLPQADLAIGLYDPATDQVAYPLWSEDNEVSERKLAPVGNDMAGYVLRTRQPLTLTEDLAGQAAIFGIDLPDRPPLSWMGAPLLAGESLLGLIAVQDSRQEARFSEDDSALLATIASQVATAIQNNRLLEETQRTARRERLIHEITSKMRRSPDTRSILDTTAREVGRALNASRATVRLGEKPSSEPPSIGQPGPAPDGEGQEP
ncbi:MAG TPA: GAF domain-containing protein [Anaerolineales bacterium]|nr:GAF domain-containing protein [Anaerolineales bacterium]